MGVYLDEVNKWRGFVKEYGEPEEVSQESLSDFEQNRVWSASGVTVLSVEGIAGVDALVNEISESDEVLSYWVTPRAWTKPPGTLSTTMTVWVDCPTCEEELSKDEDWDQSDCGECEGNGTLSIYMPNCVNAQTDEEVWAAREA